MTAVRDTSSLASPALASSAPFDQLRASYDALPYRSQPVAVTHPESLATMATLFGTSPPPLKGCRVLELGCANGANLLPMAISLPGATLRGIDLAPAQVDAGRGVIRSLNLTNV